WRGPGPRESRRLRRDSRDPRRWTRARRCTGRCRRSSLRKVPRARRAIAPTRSPRRRRHGCSRRSGCAAPWVDSIISAVDPPKSDDVTRTVIARPGAPEATGEDDRAHYLVVVEGVGPGRRFEIGGENLVVGRTKPAAIVVADPL